MYCQNKLKENDVLNIYMYFINVSNYKKIVVTSPKPSKLN